MYGYIYLTTNIVNGKKYVGLHKSNCFDYNYKGSGVLITTAINKYGKDNFTTIVLCECDSIDELNKKELYFIEKLNAVEDPMFYNIAKGGAYSNIADFDRLSDIKKSAPNPTKGTVWITNNLIYKRVKLETLEEYLSNGWIKKGPSRTERSKSNYKASKKGLVVMTDDLVVVYVKLSEVNTYLEQGFRLGRIPSVKKGTCGYVWVNNQIEQHKVKLEELDKYIENGYSQGMLKGREYHRKQPAHNKGKIIVVKDGKKRYCNPEDLDKYISEGYTKKTGGII